MTTAMDTDSDNSSSGSQVIMATISESNNSSNSRHQRKRKLLLAKAALAMAVTATVTLTTLVNASNNNNGQQQLTTTSLPDDSPPPSPTSDGNAVSNNNNNNSHDSNTSSDGRISKSKLQELNHLSRVIQSIHSSNAWTVDSLDILHSLKTSNGDDGLMDEWTEEKEHELNIRRRLSTVDVDESLKVVEQERNRPNLRIISSRRGPTSKQDQTINEPNFTHDQKKQLGTRNLGRGVGMRRSSGGGKGGKVSDIKATSGGGKSAKHSSSKSVHYVVVDKWTDLPTSAPGNDDSDDDDDDTAAPTPEPDQEASDADDNENDDGNDRQDATPGGDGGSVTAGNGGSATSDGGGSVTPGRDKGHDGGWAIMEKVHYEDEDDEECIDIEDITRMHKRGWNAAHDDDDDDEWDDDKKWDAGGDDEEEVEEDVGDELDEEVDEDLNGEDETGVTKMVRTTGGRYSRKPRPHGGSTGQEERKLGKDSKKDSDSKSSKDAKSSERSSAGKPNDTKWSSPASSPNDHKPDDDDIFLWSWSTDDAKSAKKSKSKSAKVSKSTKVNKSGKTCYVLKEPKDDSYCGSSFGDASLQCATQCMSTSDCPRGEKCYDDVTACLDGEQYCGADFGDASSQCAVKCDSDADCPGGEGCFSGVTSCAIKYCGADFADANSQCAVECDSDADCSGGESCFGGVTACSTNYCGTDFDDASSQCVAKCESNVDCPSGEGCFYGVTDCDEGEKYCGADFDDASSQCAVKCDSDADCPSGEACFDGVTACGDTAYPTFYPTSAPIASGDGTPAPTPKGATSAPTPKPTPKPTQAPTPGGGGPTTPAPVCSEDCPDCDPESPLPCPRSDLKRVCDKNNDELYPPGSDRADDRVANFFDCYDMCKPSFCCIHDSTSKEFSPSCVQEYENCPLYYPCYIIWWKLHDTIGPATYLRVEQDEPFYKDLNFEYLEQDFEQDVPFFQQLFGHHFDGDDFVLTDDTFSKNDPNADPPNDNW